MSDLYDNSIYNEDCLFGMKGLPDNSADIVIADPPYNIGKDFGNNHDNLPLNEYAAWSGKWIGECLRILKNSGTMFIYGFPEILAHISVALPIDRQRWLQWHYTNKNMPNLNFWQRSHESILCIWKDRPIFNRDKIRVPYTASYLSGSAGRKRPAGKCRLAKGNGKTTVYNAHEKGALPRDVLAVSALAGGAALKERNIYCKTCQRLIEPSRRKEHLAHDFIAHPTQKPLALTGQLICSCKPEGKFNLLVPFCGSGSECKCAMQNGGSFVSYELNSDYVILARAVTSYRNLADQEI